MIHLISLMRTTTSRVLITHSIRPITSLQQTSRKVILDTNSNINAIITRRFRTSRILREKIIKDEANKPPKVKLKSSDLKRLLSLAKSEKWKIAGASCARISQKLFIISHMKMSFRCNRLLDRLVGNHNVSSIWPGQNSRCNLCS